MTTSPFFKWEDHQAMHHCGVCNRVLTSKGAKNTCWGEHAEPCHRFHQILFMRNRGHTCDSCKIIEEAHYKRHQNIAELLRKIREVCGVAGSFIEVPRSSGGDTASQSSRSASSPDAESPSPSNGKEKESGNSTKREKKELKRLEKAANRTRFLTDQEYRHINEVLHPKAQLTSDSTPEPMNLEEVHEIERNLRFNASTCYRRTVHTEEMKDYLNNKSPPTEEEVRIKAAIDRVCDFFRITLLKKKNEKNRGLVGKERKEFDKLVDNFREALLDDYVLVYKDEMEIRMRRSAFLRYTNKAIVDKLLERYKNRDWRTGLKITTANVEEMEDGVSEEVRHSTMIGGQEPRLTLHRL